MVRTLRANRLTACSIGRRIADRGGRRKSGIEEGGSRTEDAGMARRASIHSSLSPSSIPSPRHPDHRPPRSGGVEVGGDAGEEFDAGFGAAGATVLGGGAGEADAAG